MLTRPHWDETDDARLKGLFAEVKSQDAIAALMGWSRGQIRERCKRLGLVRPPLGKAHSIKRKPPKEIEYRTASEMGIVPKTYLIPRVRDGIIRMVPVSLARFPWAEKALP